MKRNPYATAEMRAASAALTQPYRGPQLPPMHKRATVARHYRIRQGQYRRGKGNIEAWMKKAFTALITASETGAHFALMSCFVNREPTAAIVYVEGDSLHPLFVAVTPSMVLQDHDGRQAGTPATQAEECHL